MHKVFYNPSLFSSLTSSLNPLPRHRLALSLCTPVSLCVGGIPDICRAGPLRALLKTYPKAFCGSASIILSLTSSFYISFPCFDFSPQHLSWKMSVFISIPKKGNAKECSNYHTIALISHASKRMLKILQTRLQQYMNCELPNVQAGFRKGRGTRDQIANIHWIIKKAREFQKNICLCFFIDYAKAFDCLDHNKL